MSDKRYLLRAGFLALCLLAALFAPLQSQGQLFYGTSSATQGNNTVESINTDGTGNSTLFTAIGSANGSVSRCTAVALDSWNGTVFLLDIGNSALWSMNLSGTGLALVKNGLTAYPCGFALDVLNEKIYYCTSSTIQGNNTVQRMDYTGLNNTVLFTAPGGTNISRCSAIAVDVPNAKIFVADAGTNAGVPGKIWSMSLTGTGATVLASASATPNDITLDPTHKVVYFTSTSLTQSANTIQKTGYNGTVATNVFSASGSVMRCTALDLDLVAGKIYFTDGGANDLWSVPIGGGSATLLRSGLPAVARKVRLLPSASTITVVNGSDSGFGSLRQAISNLTSGGTITFPTPSGSGPGMNINLSTIGDGTYGPSAIGVYKPVTIAGPTGVTNGVTITRSVTATNMRLFYVNGAGNLSLKNLTLSNGLALGTNGGGGFQRGGAGGGSAGLGGAIFNQGSLDLEGCTLVANQAIGGMGGTSVGSANGSGGGGGGLGGPGVNGGGTVTGGAGGGPLGGAGSTGSAAGGSGGVGGGGGGGGSTTTTNGGGSGPGGGGGFGGGGGGGGAFNTVGFGGGAGGAGGGGGFGGGGGGGGAGTPDGALGVGGFGGGSGTQANSGGNVGNAGGGGGGLGGAVFNDLGTITITNSTFSANVAQGGIGGNEGATAGPGSGLGGGIFNLDGSVKVLNATFAFNQASQGGGGIYSLSQSVDFPASVTLRNTILADSISPASDFAKLALSGGTNTTTGNNNLIQINNGFTGNVVSSSNPLLGPLENNGGPTWTHELLNGSPAIDAGDDTSLPATDQRGYPRIADGNGNGVSIVDIGAVEDGFFTLTTIQQSIASIKANGFELFLTGESNRLYITEYSSNFVSWTPLATNLVGTSELAIFDTHAPSTVNRFYRAHTLP